MLDSEQLKIVNHRGETFMLHPNYQEFGVLSVEGLSMPDVTVNISESGTSDGGKHNSSRIGSRSIVIHLVMFGWSEADRKKLYRMFPPKSEITLYYRNSQFNVKTTAHVKHIDPVSYISKTKVRIELVCPDPYLHATDAITAETSGNPPACTLLNDADCEVGFRAEVVIDTEEEPTLERTVTHSETADYLRRHYSLINDPHIYTFDPDTTTLNIYVKDAYQEPGTDYNRDLLSISNDKTYLWLDFPNGQLVGGETIGIEMLWVDGQSLNNLSRSTNKVLTDSFDVYVLFRGIPMFSAKDQIHIFYDGTEQTIGEVLSESDCQYEIVPTGLAEDFWVKVHYHHSIDDTKYTEVEIYSDRDGSDVSGVTINRNVVYILLNEFCDYLLDPDLAEYDSTKDLLWVDMGDVRLDGNDYEFVTATSKIDSAEHLLMLTKNDVVISRQLTFTEISSKAGIDIREYDEDDVDNGLLLVKNLQLTNRQTQESISFPETAFQKGDKFTISTVPGEIAVTVTESDWMPVGKSLLSEVVRNSTFFKIKPGENTLRFDASVNYMFISGQFSFERLYGGV